MTRMTKIMFFFLVKLNFIDIAGSKFLSFATELVTKFSIELSLFHIKNTILNENESSYFYRAHKNCRFLLHLFH